MGEWTNTPLVKTLWKERQQRVIIQATRSFVFLNCQPGPDVITTKQSYSIMQGHQHEFLVMRLNQGARNKCQPFFEWVWLYYWCCNHFSSYFSPAIIYQRKALTTCPSISACDHWALSVVTCGPGDWGTTINALSLMVLLKILEIKWYSIVVTAWAEEPGCLCLDPASAQLWLWVLYLSMLLCVHLS